MNPLGVGIIGVGVGSSHAPGFIADERVSHVVMCDIDAERLSEKAGNLGIEETTTNWRDLIERDDIGLISVGSPDHMHHEMAIAALDAGKHVLCEKPMTMNLSEARDMIAAVERNDRKLMVNNVLRFYERFQYVKKLVDDGELGEIYAAEGDYLHNILTLIREGWRGAYRHSQMTGGGVHLIDLLRWMVGEIDEAFCYGTWGVLKEGEAKAPDCMMSVLKFKNGAIAKAASNSCIQKPALHNFILYGTKGVFINAKPNGFLYRGVDCEEPELVTAEYGPKKGEGAKSVAISHLLDAIENNTTPLVDVYEGARSIAVCDAIYDSYISGNPVKVEQL